MSTLHFTDLKAGELLSNASAEDIMSNVYLDWRVFLKVYMLFYTKCSNPRLVPRTPMLCFFSQTPTAMHNEMTL